MPDTHGFFAKLDAAVARNRSLLCVGLDPNPAQLPARYRQGDDVICRDPGLEPRYHHRADGRSGLLLQAQHCLLRSPGRARHGAAARHPGHDPRRHPRAPGCQARRHRLHSRNYAQACFDDLGVDAVTLSPYLGRDSVDRFAAHADKGLFVLCHHLQSQRKSFKLEISDWRTLDEANRPLYMHVATALVAQRRPGGGCDLPRPWPPCARPHPTQFLVPGVGAGPVTWRPRCTPGCAGSKGLIIGVSGVSLAEDHRQAAEETRFRVEELRLKIGGAGGRGQGDDQESTQGRASKSSIFNLGSCLVGEHSSSAPSPWPPAHSRPSTWTCGCW
ncbi:MAG: hypothetical protein R2838_06550 [Caldilineaceae bacterium]